MRLRAAGSGRAFLMIIAMGIGYFSLTLSAYPESTPSREGRVEAFFYLNLNSRAGAVAYAHDFPIGFSSSLPGSRGYQTLTIEPKWGPGILGGLSYLISDSVGLKLNLSYGRCKLGGENSPYVAHLEYAVATPPDYVWRSYSDDISTEWMPTEGRLESVALSLNVQYRFRLSSGVSAAASAGPGLICSFGRFNYLGYTHVWTQSFGIPWMDDYLLMMKLPAAWTLGLNMDFELSFRLSRLVSLAARISYLASKRPNVVPVIDKVMVYDTLEEADPQTATRTKNELSFGPVKLNPSAFSLGVGLKLHL